MTADDTIDQPSASAPTKSRGRRLLLIGGVVVAVLVVAGGAWAVVASQDDNTRSYDTAQIGWMHQACQQWADSYQGSNGPDDAWCTSMTDWMNGRMGENPPGQPRRRIGSMMWQDPASMRTTCEQWISTNPEGVPSGTDASASCSQMVDWMDQHMGDWDKWMMNGPVRGGS